MRGRPFFPLRGKVMNTEGLTLAKVLENKELADLVTALGCGMGRGFDLGRLRYGKVVILADADSDGHHIATLLLTFLYRHIPQLILRGKVFLAQPPLYRIDVGKETHWALDEAHRDRILKQHGNGRGNPEITRFKGLGEMMPKVLWDTTLNPKTRRLLRVEIADQIVTDRVINELMGKDASARFPLHHGAGPKRRRNSTSSGVLSCHSWPLQRPRLPSPGESELVAGAPRRRWRVPPSDDRP